MRTTSIFKRIKTLWKLSGIEDLDLVSPTGFKWTGFIKPQNPPTNTLINATIDSEPKKMAQIIKRQPKDPIEEIING